MATAAEIAAQMHALEGRVTTLMQQNEVLRGELDEQRRIQQQAGMAAAAGQPMNGAGFQQAGRSTGAVVDTRLIGRPKSFTGRDEDWPGWALILRAYAGAISQRLLYLMDHSEALETQPTNAALIGGDGYSPDQDRELSVQLYYVLVMLMEGKAADKVALVGRGEGLTLWKSLIDQYESKLMTRRTGLLQQVLGFSFNTDDVINDIERFERLIKTYETTKSEELADDIKVGVVIRNLGEKHPEMSRHLVLNSHRLDAYAAVKQEIIDVFRTRRFLSTGAAPMDIGAFGKDSCGYCGKRGHDSSNCWSKPGKGKGQGDKGKGGKNGKGKQNEKGKNGKSGKGGKGADHSSSQRFEGECSYCGTWGHRRRDCRKLAAKKGGGEKRTALNEMNAETDDRGLGCLSVNGLDLATVDDESGHSPAIGAVSDQSLVRIGVDSCAGVTVWPTALHPEYPTKPTAESRAGKEYLPAGAGSAGVRDRGQRTYRLKGPAGQDLEMKVRVADVRRPLLSVAEMNDAGLDVHFFSNRGVGAYAENPRNGERIKLRRVDNVFEFVASVTPWSGGPRQA